MRARPACASAAIALLVVGSCSGNRGADPASRFFAVHNVMRALGLYQAGPVNQGSLAPGQEVKLPLMLPATCVAVVAMGGTGVDDLTLRLLDPEGNVVAQEASRDVEAVLRTCVDRPGPYVVVLGMTQGSGDYLVSSWMGGEAVGEAGTPALASGGTCDAPTMLLPDRNYTGTTDGAADDEEGSCAGSGGGRERVYRLDLPTRQRVAIDLSAEFDAVLYIRKAECNDDAAEVRCNDDSGPKHSRVDAVLDPGMYFIFVDGYGDEAGPYRLQATTHDAPKLSDVCRTARPLAAFSRVVGNANSAFDNVSATCGRDAKGVDMPFRFDLPARARVRFVEKSADFRPVIHVRRACEDPSTEVACADSGFAEGEAAWAGVLEPGPYWVFADGADEASPGMFTLAAETVPEGGSGIASGTQGDGCGDALQLAGPSGRVEGDTFAAKDDVSISCALGGGADIVYRLDIAHRSRVTARIIGDESSHAIAFERVCADKSTELSCGAIIDRVIDPGTYFVIADGARPESLGRFSFAYRVRDMVEMEAACARVPAITFKQPKSGTTSGAGDKFSSACSARGVAQGSPDRVFRFSVPRRMGIRLTLESQGFRGLLSIRRVCTEDATEVRCAEAADDTASVAVQAVLDPGRYYAVVDGSGSNAEGAFTLRLDGFEEPSGRGPKTAR